MKVYLVIENQLDEHHNITGTRVVDVCATPEKANSVKASFQYADAAMVRDFHADPCEYEIETHYVTE